jgi:cyclopropane fatty-acyl-phospholipid synthase-like methyltransferase
VAHGGARTELRNRDSILTDTLVLSSGPRTRIGKRIHMTLDDRFVSERFPRSVKYDPGWVLASISGAANALWMSEWLAAALDLRPGMRVLDLGCGRAVSSIFLCREFGVQVWATDLWFSASENLRRIQDAGAGDGVFPIHADARSLPFATEFFDAIACIDCFPYFGTDDLYLNYLARFMKAGGQVGIAGAGLMRELEGSPPEHLREWWTQDAWCLHSVDWWRRHWERTGLVDVEIADTMPDGWKVWLEWHKMIAPENQREIKALEADHGNYLGYIRCVGRLLRDANLADPIVSLPTEYTKKPLLRTGVEATKH